MTETNDRRPERSPDDPSRTVLLAGATGYLGRAVACALVERGYRVLAPVRSLAGARNRVPEACELVETRLTDRKALAVALRGRRAGAVVSCLASRNGMPEDAWRVDHGANSALLAAAPGLGAERFVLLSALCVQKPRLAFQHAKLAFEAELRASELAWTIVRPTAFFKSLSGQIARVRSGKPFLVFGDGRLTATKPVSERDLAAYIVDCLESSSRRGAILPVGGPGPAVTPREQGEWLFEMLGRPPRFRSVSPSLLIGAAGLTGALGRVIPSLAARSELARIGHYYATESMLVWDEKRGRYDAAATPETGRDTLKAFYRKALNMGLSGQELGAHKMFR